MLLVTNFGSHYDPNVSGTPGSAYGELVKLAVLAYSGQFCMILVTDFGSRCDPNVSGTLGGVTGTRQNLQFWPIPASFEIGRAHV